MERVRTWVRPESVIAATGLFIIALVAIQFFLVQVAFDPAILVTAGSDANVLDGLLQDRVLLLNYSGVLILLVLAIFVGLALMLVRERRAGDLRHTVLERKIDERTAQLHTQEVQYRRIVETAHEGILMVGADNKISYANPQTTEILGYSTQELIGTPIVNFLPPEEKSEAVAGLETVGISAASGELRIRRKTGQESWVLWSSVPYRDEANRYAGSLFLFSDITENKRAQDALQANEELYRSVIEVMPLCMFRKDREGHITFGNSRFWSAIGLDEQTGLGKTDYDTSPRELADKYRKDDLTVMETGETVEMVEAFQPPTGQPQIIRVIKSPVHDRLGTIQGVQVMFWDITEGRRQSELLREREELLSRILETVEDGIYITDGVGKLTFANRTTERILGATRQEICESSYDDIRWQMKALDGTPFPDAEQPFRRVITTGEPVFDVQQTIQRADGSYAVVSINAAPLHDAQGQLVGEVASMTDITARKHAEAKLLESERMLAKAQQIAHIGSWRWDMQRDAVELSAEMYCIAGMAPGVFPESTVGFIEGAIHPEDRAKVAETNRLAMQGVAAPVEYRIVRPNGQERIVWAEGEITCDATGAPVGMVGVVQDITERKHAEDALRRQNEYLDALHQTTISLMGRLELHDLLHAITQRAATLVGTSHGYIYLAEPGQTEMVLRVGIGGFMPLVGDKAEYGAGATGRVWATREPLVIDDYQAWDGRRNKPGSAGWHALVSVPLTSNEQVIGIFGLAHTEPNKKFDHATVNLLTRFAQLAAIALDNARLYDAAQQELAERKVAEEKFRSLFDASPDAIVLIDPSQPKWPIVDCNPVTCEMNGYTRAELIGSSIDILNTSEGTPEERALYLAAVRQQGVMRVEAEHRHKDGHLFSIESSTCIIQVGDLELVMGIDRDVTKRKEVDRMKTEFISTVSHELRTPLTSIRGSLGLIAGGVAGQIPERAKSMVDIAYKNSERLVRLINDILDVEKIESGKMVFQLKPIELVPLIEQAIEANRAYGEQYHVRFVLQSAPVGLKINADADRITQVLTNLLSNAAKFSPPQGSIDIRAERVGELIRVSVQDHGGGIPDEFKSRIFQKFAQADSSDTRQKGGTGLGLSIVKAIVEKHGGTIGFETEAGHGTTFYFELPGYQITPAAEPAPAESRERILILEDDHDVALLLQMMLAQGGFEADMAYDRKQALEMLHIGHYAALTLDLLLPDEDGIAFVRELRSKPETRALPIVVVSAKAEQGALQLNGDAVWVSDWLQKPIDQQKLVHAVQDASRGVRPGKPRILHVEDDGDVLQVVRAILQEMADVIPAATLAEALALLESSVFDLVILDAVLPDGSGLDLLPSLRRDGAQIPVVIFSANENEAKLSGQINAALVKARTSNEQLLQTITNLIPQRRLAAVGGTI